MRQTTACSYLFGYVPVGCILVTTHVLATFDAVSTVVGQSHACCLLVLFKAYLLQLLLLLLLLW
jgi:hypothetical protein